MFSLTLLSEFTDISTLVLIMAWCRQETSHYLNRTWPESILSHHMTSLGPVSESFYYTWTWLPPVNSLATGKFERNFGYVIFKPILVIDGWGICCEIALIWMSLDVTDDQSKLVPVMAWCRQATSHYLSQCWPRSLSPYGVTRPQWVLRHWSLNKVAKILQRTFSNSFSCMQKFCILIQILLSCAN